MAVSKIRHFFHVVSNIRPIVWICLYVCLIPIFALIYNWLPEGQFRIPDNGHTDYGSWLYYSIVTITTLGFGDYTPALPGAQAVTAIEVACGLLVMGFFLNAVGSMKSEIEVDAALEKQRLLHEAQERDKLLKSIPMALHAINLFLERCDNLAKSQVKSDEELRALLRAGNRAALCLDSMQNRIDITLWPDLLESCFSFVADYQMFSAEDSAAESSNLQLFIEKTRKEALSIETSLTAVSVATAAPAQA